MCEIAKKNNYFFKYTDKEDGALVMIDRIPKDKVELIKDALLFNELVIKGREEAEREKATGIDW